eukprot:CAMPEP_0117477128 /NCGR_PEP_ID=MMETSP0784-20121206/10665_1 /TAXON_ID=39447 /ORGANISM="" /LENGTH=322 /DNA_ID=CAMNT_0005271425 /DNA_START=52 /DNA_END=1017 /DNA_ORIENTATION=-
MEAFESASLEVEPRLYSEMVLGSDDDRSHEVSSCRRGSLRWALKPVCFVLAVALAIAALTRTALSIGTVSAAAGAIVPTQNDTIQREHVASGRPTPANVLGTAVAQGGDRDAVTSPPLGEPRLCLFEPCSTHELGNRYDSWCPCWGPDFDEVSFDCMSYNLCDNGTKQCCGVDEVPPVARAVAESLRGAMPHLNETPLVLSSESMAGGEVIAVVNPGYNLTKVLPEVLGISHHLEAAFVQRRNWSNHRICGFNLHAFTRYCPDIGWAWNSGNSDITHGLLAHDLKVGTGIMADALVDGFLFNFNDDNTSVAPVIYGGYTTDG